MRKIIHIDMDAFFASVEQRDNPELRGRPVAVGGSGRGGIVASASYEARAYGVRSAMPGSRAAALCPALIFVRGSHEKYSAVGKQIRDIFFRFTDLVEPVSIDEAYLDVTVNKFGIASATRVASEIRKCIFEETGLSASAGVSFNKFLAKVASGYQKPNGQTVITPEQAPAFLSALPIAQFHGIGAATARKMHRLGIHTGADLLQWSKIDLARIFGKTGIWYYQVVRGLDERPVRTTYQRKSVGAEETFSRNLSSESELVAELALLCDKVADRLHKLRDAGRTLTLKMKSASFEVVTRSKSFPDSMHDRHVLFNRAQDLLLANIEQFESYRLLGLTVSGLDSVALSGTGIQLEFDFGDDT